MTRPPGQAASGREAFGREVASRLTRWPKSHTVDTVFQPFIIQHAVWLYPRFTLSYRDVEDLCACRPGDSRVLTRRREFGTMNTAKALPPMISTLLNLFSLKLRTND
jgi:hypothetical protein